MRNVAMCEQCKEMDRRIMHLRTLVSGLTDEQTIRAAHEIIEEMERRKAALHPE
jgi:hypothetical protein